MDDLERIVRAYNAACSGDDTTAIVAFFVEDAVIYDLNHPPVVGRDAIGRFWGKVRARWAGATWDTDLVVSDGHRAAAEWTMHGRTTDGPFAFHGTDLFRFAAPVPELEPAPEPAREPVGGRRSIVEIRQYWRFDPAHLDSGLVGYPYPTR